MLKKIIASGGCWLWMTALILILDQYSKHWVSTHLALGESLSVLPIFNLTLAHNTGAAFSFLDGASGWQNIFFSSLAILVSIIILYWLLISSRKIYDLTIGLCCVLGGTLGNAIDRFRYHYVIDFLDFHIKHWHFAIFNIADSAIFIGACLLIWHWMHEK